jgi:hypothetical protein
MNVDRERSRPERGRGIRETIKQPQSNTPPAMTGVRNETAQRVNDRKSFAREDRTQGRDLQDLEMDRDDRAARDDDRPM